MESSNQVVRIDFKCEDFVGSEPVGPATEMTEADIVSGGRKPFDPDAEPPKWITVTEARALAAKHDVPLWSAR